ncbi:hypothetical protein [Motiliproteus sp.]|uniref:Nmad3 family putative nucleotide modification protein n=1 Tax=Motiliproteus sp. TaxID=1898955 RepID=UPI003BACB96B
MKIIISRKGFDLSSGGCPSPILPDGRMISLPIPDSRSGICYRDLNQYGINFGDLVDQLGGSKVGSDNQAHLDPDLSSEVLARQPGWLPVFGQMKQAQGHLHKQGVAEGDLFLFFGLYQAVKETAEGWAFDRSQPKQHVLWGWMQVGKVVLVSEDTATQFPWAAYHPHLVSPDITNNTLYLAANHLSLGDADLEFAGAGVFPNYDSGLVLTETASEASKPRVSRWRLPGWFCPYDSDFDDDSMAVKPPITYLGAAKRWQPDGETVLLDTSGRWQEAVLDADHYPEAQRWALALIASNAGLDP